MSDFKCLKWPEQCYKTCYGLNTIKDISVRVSSKKKINKKHKIKEFNEQPPGTK